MGPRWHCVRYVMAITKAFLIAELPRKTRAFLIAPVLSGISSDLIKSQWRWACSFSRSSVLSQIAAAIWLIRLPMR
jgi:hypothetical protein